MTLDPKPDLGLLLDFLRERAKGRGHLQRHDADRLIEPLLDAMIALGTAAASPAPEGWRSMESAPRDGTPILVVRWADNMEPDDDLGPEAGVIAHWAHWGDHRGWYASGFSLLAGSEPNRFLVVGNGEITDNGWPELRPTHWMPLAEPPAAPVPQHPGARDG